MARVKPTRPCFATEPWTRRAAPESDTMPPSVTMLPPPALIISGTQALARWKAPSSVIESGVRHSSYSSSRNGRSVRTEALSTRKSTRPKRLTT
ncbi:hypothetical protein D3C83_96950 [compost metagenome]